MKSNSWFEFYPLLWTQFSTIKIFYLTIQVKRIRSLRIYSVLLRGQSFGNLYILRLYKRLRGLISRLSQPESQWCNGHQDNLILKAWMVQSSNPIISSTCWFTKGIFLRFGLQLTYCYIVNFFIQNQYWIQDTSHCQRMFP